MTEQTISPPLALKGSRRRREHRVRRATRLVRNHSLIAAAAVLVAAIVFVLATGMRPAYDAYGWLVWGRQALHLHLNTDAAPSWKPLTFLFTFPYAVLAGRAALWLWMVTAVAGAFAAAVFAGRIAYRLTGPAPGRRYAPVVAAVFAGAAVFGIAGYWHFILIATADPMLVAFCLAAVDFHLAGRPRWAFAMLVCTALGRPEAVALALLYALWAWRGFPAMRIALATGLLLIPILWLAIPAITSHSALIASDVSAASTDAVQGNKVTGVLRGFVTLYELPMQLGVLVAVVLAIVWRERTWLLLIGAALVWLAAEVVLAARGLGIAPRYMFEPAALLIVLVAAAVGRVLATASYRRLIGWIGIVAVLALVSTLVPHARIRARLAHNGIILGHNWARQIHRLHEVIAKERGPKRILACGAAVTTVPWQSILAWEMDQNVSQVGWLPGAEIRTGRPIVLFEPRGAGWQIRPIHIPAAKQKRCAGLRRDTAFNAVRPLGQIKPALRAG